MSVEENKALVRRWIEGVNRGDPATSARVVSRDYRMNGLTLGPEGARQYSAVLLEAFPDWHGRIEDLIAEGDIVVVRLTYSGTHRGDLVLPATGRLAATGKAVSIPSVEVYRLAGGKVAEGWISADRFGLLQQLGLLPTPGQAE
jgi:C-1 hydroxylase